MKVVKVRWLVRASYRSHGQVCFADNQPLSPLAIIPSLEGIEVPGIGMVTMMMKIT